MKINENGISLEHQAVVDFVEASGIDPQNLAAEGFDRDGYWRFDRDANGARYIGPDGKVARTRQDWPANFDYDTFLRKTIDANKSYGGLEVFTTSEEAA